MDENGEDYYVVYGSAESSVSHESDSERERTWVMQRGLWLPKNYAQATRPIGFIWE